MKKFSNGYLLILSLLLASCASSASSAPRAESAYGYTQTETVERSRASFDGAPSGGPSQEAESRMITYSVSLELSVTDTEDTRRLITEQVKTFDGYITRDSNNAITMRIPSEKMDDFLIEARKLGKVENESKTGVDITEQYRDNVIRLESLKSVRERYLLLLGRANSVSDILSIEKELERVNSQIELMEGRIKNAETSVAYSNISIRFYVKAKPGPIGWVFVGLYRGIRWLFVWE